MIRRPPRSTLSSSSAASDVYKRQERDVLLPTIASTELTTSTDFARGNIVSLPVFPPPKHPLQDARMVNTSTIAAIGVFCCIDYRSYIVTPVSYTHLRA